MSFEIYKNAGDVELASERPITVVRPHDHDIAHLASSELVMEVVIDPESKSRVLVPVRVYYSNHCFTRSRDDGDVDEDVLYIERLRDGVLDERVYCPDRWEFSKQLPKLVGALASALCFPGNTKEIFYRVQPARGDLGDAGWYLCGKLDVNVQRQEITLSVRSVHHRSTRPDTVRGIKQRFWAIFAKFYRAVRPRHVKWLAAKEKEKAPQ